MFRFNFAESIATVQANLREVQPTILFGVPRIWEKMLAGVQHPDATTATWLKRAFGRFWLRVADGISETLVRTGGRHTVGTRVRYAIGWLFFYRALRERIGMRQVRHAVSAAAPIAPEVLRFFMGIGVPMHEAYGMTENTAIATGTGREGSSSVRWASRMPASSCGSTEPPERSSPGIRARSPGTSANEEATARTMIADGWLHTGDVGEWVDGTLREDHRPGEGHHHHCGREECRAEEIENALKASPFIKEAIVIGDARPYLVALIGIELETVGDWAQLRRASPTPRIATCARSPRYARLFRRSSTKSITGSPGLSRSRSSRMLPKEFDHEDGELTATQKVKRTAIAKLFGDLVEDMYQR